MNKFFIQHNITQVEKKNTHTHTQAATWEIALLLVGKGTMESGESFEPSVTST